MQVIKIGGNELDDPDFLPGLARAVTAVDDAVIIVHGGGRAIAEWQTKAGLSQQKVDGLRVTDRASLNIAQMVLSGQANKQIVAALLAAGVDAMGLSGVDRGLLRCRKKEHPAVELGFVGDIVQVRADVLQQLLAEGVTPVISPISLGLDGHVYNVNADAAAGAIAAALGAARLDFVSNVPAVQQDGRLIAHLTAGASRQLIASGVIYDGMTAKVQAALDALAQGVGQVRITNLDGLARRNGALPAGTLFTGNGRHREIRPARPADIPGIVALVNEHARRGDLLPRTAVAIRDTLPDWLVGVQANRVVACVALLPYAPHLAEVRSLAVADPAKGQGWGSLLVQALVEAARQRQFTTLFALTRAVPFFQRAGFTISDKALFPEKVWRDCEPCPLKHNCDETAVVLYL